MKRFFAIFTVVALMLTACAAQEADTRVEDLQERFASMSGCAARVNASVVKGEETLRYTLDVTRKEGETRVAVLEPEALAGISAVVREDGALSLEFDGMVLDAGSDDPGVSALNGTSVFLHAAAEGYVTERGTERFADTEDALRLCFETEHAGETLLVTAYFSAEDVPLYAEIERGGEILAYLEFTEFTFRDILPTA